MKGLTVTASAAAAVPTATAASAAPIRLTGEEVAELTERLFDASQRGEGAEGVPIETCLSMFLGHVPEEAIRAAVQDVVSRRERRLSSVLRRKADELERMLLSLLPRLDATFHASVRLGLPGTHGGAGEGVVLDLSAERGELEVRARRVGPGGVERLFSLLVRARREERRWPLRWLPRAALRTERVTVLDPAGLGLEELLAWTLERGGGGGDLGRGRAVGFALERLRDTVLGEVERAMGFVRDLRFDAEGGAADPDVPAGAGGSRSDG